jgi:Suppressor of fused protein (SUFU)
MKDLFSKILRYGAPSGDPRVADSAALGAIEKHIETHLGGSRMVLHEVGSRYVHIDVPVIAPQPDRDFYTLVTSGMSDRPMKAPKQAEGLEYSELMLCLPSNWTMKEFDVMSQETWNRDWPVIWLRQLARFPHQYKTWLFWGHSVPNGDPAMPFTPDTALCGWVLLEPRLVSDGFKVMTSDDGRKTLFHAAVPVYKEEMDLKLKEGAEKLQDLLVAKGITELVDPHRANAISTK